MSPKGLNHTPRFKKRFRHAPTEESLAAAALHYLERYAASEASLRRVLQNKLRRAAFMDEAFAADETLQTALKDKIEALVQQYKKSGVIDDAAFADMKVRSLRRSGGSARRIAQKLTQKGVAAVYIEKALAEQVAEAENDPERAAARTFAKKRALGPFRPFERRATDFEGARLQARKDYAALLRAGFSFDAVRAVLEIAEDEAEAGENF